jgi:hypothetical protein
VPKIGPKETRDFEITYSLLSNAGAVSDALKRVEAIQQGRKTEVRETPLVDLNKEKE